jgi:hypothetical protein
MGSFADSKASAEGTVRELAAQPQSARDAANDFVEKMAPPQLELPSATRRLDATLAERASQVNRLGPA